MKNFFNLKGQYKFEYNDIRAVFTVLNVILILRFGLSIAWISLTIAGVGIVKDLTIDRKINNVIMHTSNFILYSILLLTNI